MPTITINGTEVEVSPGTSILQACEQIGIEIPRFCYHERLSVPANCRMCLVEMKGSPKPVASCAMPAADKMEVFTDTELVHKARKGVMEFLLINHPLDCPICDQGGECDLQDQALGYGFDRGRYLENKRAVDEKYMGPLIQTFMTRCIQCTRCIRFADEIAGVPELGLMGRNEGVEIGTYVEKAIASELSGNLVDVCPVGALTSKPYAFAARPWELRKTDSVDVLDAVGCNIRIDARGPEVLRVLPRVNDDINEEWIADKSRHAVDGLTRQRLDRPYVRRDGKLQPATWPEALKAIAGRLAGIKGERIAAIAGDLVDCESVMALKDLMTALGSPNLDCRQGGGRFDPAARAGYIFNSTIAGIEQADAILIAGSNPRWEAPIINARIRKRSLQLREHFQAAVIGANLDLTYPYQYLGAGPQTLAEVAEGRHPFAEALRNAKAPMLILGSAATARPDGLAIHALARQLAVNLGLVRDGWNGFNMLHRAAGRVGALDLGFVPSTGGRDLTAILDGAGKGDIEAVYLLGADEIDTAKLGQAFVIYQGHHGDRGAHRADVILPGAAYTEKSATYVNTEGRAQLGRQAVHPPGDAREDWRIIRALAEAVGKTLPYDSLGQVRRRLAEASPVFRAVDQIVPAEWSAFAAAGPIDAAPFALPIANYYMTDPVSRSSPTMAKCVEELGVGRTQRTGTNG
ncbi:MAG TPA: NADH-quinone oxidoreductase subunit NuoG [Alphaproteobacteria bacterium]|nr:NADH-quinone oxidoreductase subunit NuoG [Alphaproteobacteria bacterium]